MQTPDRALARSPMADIEDRLGIDPIGELLAERLDLVDQVADLRAVHGSFGTFDAQRKSQLSTIKMSLRAQAVRDKVKKSEAQLEEEARADVGYIDFIAVATSNRAQLARLEARIDAIDATIRRANAVAYFCANEARL